MLSIQTRMLRASRPLAPVWRAGVIRAAGRSGTVDAAELVRALRHAGIEAQELRAPLKHDQRPAEQPAFDLLLAPTATIDVVLAQWASRLRTPLLALDPRSTELTHLAHNLSRARIFGIPILAVHTPDGRTLPATAALRITRKQLPLELALPGATPIQVDVVEATANPPLESRPSIAKARHWIATVFGPSGPASHHNLEGKMAAVGSREHPLTIISDHIVTESHEHVAIEQTETLLQLVELSQSQSRSRPTGS